MDEVNNVPTRDMAQSITGCCPPFDPNVWDNKTLTFKGKQFIKLTTRSLFYIPLNMNQVMAKATAATQKADASNSEYFMLSRELSPWKAEHLLAVNKQVPGYEQVVLSGTYMTKVFEGPYSNVRKWYQDLNDMVVEEGLVPETVYFDYVYCPRCANAYRHNYVVGVVKIKESPGRAVKKPTDNDDGLDDHK